MNMHQDYIDAQRRLAAAQEALSASQQELYKVLERQGERERAAQDRQHALSARHVAAVEVASEALRALAEAITEAVWSNTVRLPRQE